MPYNSPHRPLIFRLDQRLKNDCIALGTLPLCQVLLMRDARYPWLILVPQRAGVQEIYHLDADDQEQLIWESSFVAQQIMTLFNGDKLNIAALGNAVAQLHIHHIVRFKDDAAWPKPVWGQAPPLMYIPEQLTQRIEQLHKALATSTFVAL